MEDIKVELNTSSNEREVEAQNISFNIAANFRKGLKSFYVFFCNTNPFHLATMERFKLFRMYK